MTPPDRNAWITLVPAFPLDHLWLPSGITGHRRVRYLLPEDVDALLASSPALRLVQARPGSQIRWYPRGAYGFWHHHANPHGGYRASEWLDPHTGDRALLFQTLPESS